MSTDSDSSASSKEHCKQKKNKKLKRKSEKKKHKKKEKKEKKHKDKKNHHKEKLRIEPNFPISVLDKKDETIGGNVDAFGPALPPHLLKTDKTLIGPTMPSEILNSIESAATKSSEMSENDNAATSVIDGEIDDMYFSFGPMPVSSNSDGLAKMSSTQIELEQRALELKLAAIEGTANTTDINVREEWMLELPEVGLKGGLAALSNMKRTFHQGKERPDFSDRSSWTKTPHDETKPSSSTSKTKTTADALKRSAEDAYEKHRDEEQARLAKKHKKQHKRDESLVDIHQKKLRKERKKREKELASAGAKPERRPFSRDVDLKLNKIDKNQTKQIVDKAKILNTKFASGKTKYL
ncbi:GPALPP motifs-containing protein 1 [Bactrocera oleae]|uniref:GPALPP motifs-containing protein 1 n=1 Tax=Bactrocera oleae TaxID=104688 RepID=UPI0006B70E46|nr:GPALPP motifs-containing protein 1 [Bactrocera oleae]